MSGSPKKESSGSLGFQYRRVCKNKSFNYIADGGNPGWGVGKAGNGKNARIWSLWRQDFYFYFSFILFIFFPPGAIGETMGMEIWDGFQGETGWGYHIYEI